MELTYLVDTVSFFKKKVYLSRSGHQCLFRWRGLHLVFRKITVTGWFKGFLKAPVWFTSSCGMECKKNMLDIGHRTMTNLDNWAAGGQKSVSIYKLMLGKASETASLVNEDLKLGLFLLFGTKVELFGKILELDRNWNWTEFDFSQEEWNWTSSKFDSEDRNGSRSEKNGPVTMYVFGCW